MQIPATTRVGCNQSNWADAKSCQPTVVACQSTDSAADALHSPARLL